MKMIGISTTPPDDDEYEVMEYLPLREVKNQW
jgi:hypothetical protein